MQEISPQNGCSPYETGGTFGITQKTSWFVHRRIRSPTSMESSDKLLGELGVDETFWRSLARSAGREKQEAGMAGAKGRIRIRIV
jgi:hypothetical protein